MQSKAKTVTEYMREVPANHLDALTELREICVQSLPGFKESMAFGSPSYSHNGDAEVWWKSQKNGISLFLKNEELLENFTSRIKSYEIDKNHIRFKNPEKIEFEQISKLLKEVSKSKQTPFI